MHPLDRRLFVAFLVPLLGAAVSVTSRAEDRASETQRESAR